MYKKNRNSLIHERLRNEAKLDVTIRWVRTVLRFCRLFHTLIEPNKSNIAWLRFRTFYYQSYWSKGVRYGNPYLDTGQCYACPEFLVCRNMQTENYNTNQND